MEIPVNEERAVWRITELPCKASSAYQHEGSLGSFPQIQKTCHGKSATIILTLIPRWQLTRFLWV